MSSIYQPVKRIGHSSVQVGDYLYIWGGGEQPGLPGVHNNKEKKSMCSVVEVCHVPTGMWVQKPTTGNPPLGVEGYTAAVIRNELFFFGGYCGHLGCFHNSLYSFNVDTFNWKELSPTTSHHSPMMKDNCAMVALCLNDEDYLAVIGGAGSSSNNTRPQPGAQYSGDGDLQRCNEVHMYRLKTGKWTSPTVTGDRPPPISAFTLTSITNTTAILFGGNFGDRRCDDVYVFQFTDTSVNCTKFPNPRGSVQWPKGRSDHSSVLINCSSGPHVVVVGGLGTKDCWLLNNKMKWKQLTYIPDSVTDRSFHSLSVWSETPTTHWIIEFGGWRDGSFLSETKFIEIISSTGDLVVQSVLDINEYQKRRVLEGLAKVHITKDPALYKDILDKKPQTYDLLRLFNSSAAHYKVIGIALSVPVRDLLPYPEATTDNLILVFQRWIESDKGVTWRKILQVCEDYPDQLGQAKAEVKGFLSSDRARNSY
ncbi:PREDICTED: kelch domain-containing protein 1-like [Amphimedon queenslandica]|uniref:Death domain-containing protein n=2 Tax=Amphimedon queenslandica TaxID=400682 RepID=A0AAN0J463_AMPQE|nr:PREDICTED: kelch domain-containing protein 1-like [Amphimedon queenslandica]|eukprot:XP_019851541.1 PREDICTED: kelch domain-containing protein 1-like [Amphimedon queenslandica]